MCPRLDKVVIKLNLSTFFDKSLAISDSDNQIRAFFLFYLIFSSSPLIKVKYYKTLKLSQASIFLKLTLRDISSINEFLVRFFLENNPEINVTNSQLSQQKFTCHSSIEFGKFLDINKFFNKILANSRPNQLSVELKFVFVRFPINLNKINLIQNQFLFWNI